MHITFGPEIKQGFRKKVCYVSLIEDSWPLERRPDRLVHYSTEGELPGKNRRRRKKMGWIENIKHWTDGGLKVANGIYFTPFLIIHTLFGQIVS